MTDLELAGVDVPQGSMVVLYLAGANRDPAAYDDPDRFDLWRTEGAEHLAFSAGIHYCLGAPLARLEATVALERLVQRFPSCSAPADFGGAAELSSAAPPSWWSHTQPLRPPPDRWMLRSPSPARAARCPTPSYAAELPAISVVRSSRPRLEGICYQAPPTAIRAPVKPTACDTTFGRRRPRRRQWN